MRERRKSDNWEREGDEEGEGMRVRERRKREGREGEGRRG